MNSQLFRRISGPIEWRWPRLASHFVAVIPVLAVLLAVYWLVPRFSFKETGSLDASDQVRIHQFIEDVHASVKTPSNTVDGKNLATKAPFVPTCQDCTDYRETTIALTPLVRLLVKIPITVLGAYDRSAGKLEQSFSYFVRDPEYYPIVRADNIVLTFLIVVGLTLGLRAVRFSPSVGLLGDPSRRLGPIKRVSAEALLESDVVKAEERARDVYKRSTILLGGGIVMAFVGVALFYVTLPVTSGGAFDPRTIGERDRQEEFRYEVMRRLDYLSEDRIRPRSDLDDLRHLLAEDRPTGEEHPWLTFASHSLRPTGMLIFMEGIAWFLLRQYRVLIEEYKSFLRVYLKRSSYLVAWKAASSSPDKQLAVAQAMISEDMIGTLNKDETTEALETMRLNEPTPIVEILREVKALIPAIPRK